MMIKVYTLEQAEGWDKIVKSFENYDVFYISEYAKAFMNEHPSNGEPMLLLYENGLDKAINVVVRRDIAHDKNFTEKIEENTYFDLITPYGYGGFWGNVTDWDKLNSCYEKYCINSNYICEFVRFNLFNDYYSHYQGIAETRTHNVIRSLEMSFEDMWMDFKPKVRKNVKKANSYNLEIIIESTGEHLDDFLKIYYSTMDRAEAKSEYYFSKQFYLDINRMKDNIMYFYVVYDGKIISAELVLYGSENCYSYLGGTYKEYFNVRPNDFLKYEIIKWAKEKGLKNFVLGGGYGFDDGIYQYKLNLAPHGTVDFYIGKKIFNKEKYDALVKLRNNIKDSNFFPQYRG